MTHIKSKLMTYEIQAFRKFLEVRGFKCRDGKGEWQALQVQNISDKGWKAFCHNAKGVVTSPVEFDALIQVFRAPVDPVPAVEALTTRQTTTVTCWTTSRLRRCRSWLHSKIRAL